MGLPSNTALQVTIEKEYTMNTRRILLCGLVLSLGLLTGFQSGRAGLDGINGTSLNLHGSAIQAGGVVTLYALDPLAQSFCFGDGREGRVIQYDQVKNRCSDIDFNQYYAGEFSVGIEGGRLGRIVDLGSASDLERAYRYGETVGSNQGFASLRIEDRKAVILKDRKTQGVQELKESTLLFQQGISDDHVSIRLGDIYLVRITDRFDKSFERIVKFRVIAYAPNESVTLRWYGL